MISRGLFGLNSRIDQAELDWLRERGVEVDRKGRIVVRLPQPDDELEFRDDEASISSLMRRDVRRKGGTRGPRRTPHKGCNSAATQAAKRRRGRPIIGDETRIRVQTTIDPSTRDTLRRHRRTLADVFDGCVQELTSGL